MQDRRLAPALVKAKELAVLSTSPVTAVNIMFTAPSDMTEAKAAAAEVSCLAPHLLSK